MARILLNLSRLTCKGVFFSLVLFIRVAILPISVFMPVSVITATALPYVTRLPEYTIFNLSARGVSLSNSMSFLSILVDSPVRELSFTCRE